MAAIQHGTTGNATGTASVHSSQSSAVMVERKGSGLVGAVDGSTKVVFLGSDGMTLQIGHAQPYYLQCLRRVAPRLGRHTPTPAPNRGTSSPASSRGVPIDHDATHPSFSRSAVLHSDRHSAVGSTSPSTSTASVDNPGPSTPLAAPHRSYRATQHHHETPQCQPHPRTYPPCTAWFSSGLSPCPPSSGPSTHISSNPRTWILRTRAALQAPLYQFPRRS